MKLLEREDMRTLEASRRRWHGFSARRSQLRSCARCFSTCMNLIMNARVSKHKPNVNMQILNVRVVAVLKQGSRNVEPSLIPDP